MKSSCNQLQHLTNTIPSPFARLNKHPDLLQASEISWHMAHLCRKDFQKTTPWKQKVKKTCLVCPDSFQSNKHDKLQDYHLQILRFIKLVNGSTEQTAETNITKSQGTPPPQLQQHEIWGFRELFNDPVFTTEASLFTHRHITIVTSASMQQNHFWASNCMGSIGKNCQSARTPLAFLSCDCNMMLYPCQVCSAPGGIANTWWKKREGSQGPLPDSEMNWYHTKRLMKHLFQTPHDSWNELRWHWNKMN